LYTARKGRINRIMPKERGAFITHGIGLKDDGVAATTDLDVLAKKIQSLS
jgi:hypothetical protein